MTPATEIDWRLLRQRRGQYCTKWAQIRVTDALQNSQTAFENFMALLIGPRKVLETQSQILLM